MQVTRSSSSPVFATKSTAMKAWSVADIGGRVTENQSQEEAWSNGRDAAFCYAPARPA